MALGYIRKDSFGYHSDDFPEIKNALSLKSAIGICYLASIILCTRFRSTVHSAAHSFALFPFLPPITTHQCLLSTQFPLPSSHTKQNSSHSQILPKELQQRLISPLILALHPRILQITPRRHPPMNLIAKNLHMFLALQILLELLHVGLRLVAAS